jgi:hypothetical protein
MREGVTLQINLAPTDLPHARLILPHQLRCWAGQVAEVVLTVDLHRSRNRYATGWAERLPGLRDLVVQCCRAHHAVRSCDVDYSAQAQTRVADTFFGGRPAPAKDSLGAPFYAYFAGLLQATTRYVLHMDSDILYGGGSQVWVGEARSLMAVRPEVLACNPLPGPPTADGSLRSQSLEREPSTTVAYRAPHLSTRLFLIDMDRLRGLAPLEIRRASWRHALLAGVEGHPRCEPAETALSVAMAARGMLRVDFLGSAPGMWSLHPPFRSRLFYQGLPDLVDRVERGEIPEAQRGRHDVDDSMVDWTSARPGRRRRMLRYAREAVDRLGPDRGNREAGSPLRDGRM